MNIYSSQQTDTAAPCSSGSRSAAVQVCRRDNCNDAGFAWSYKRLFSSITSGAHSLRLVQKSDRIDSDRSIRVDPDQPGSSDPSISGPTFVPASLFCKFWLFRNFYSGDSHHANYGKHSLNYHFRHGAHSVYKIYSVLKLFEIALCSAQFDFFEISTAVMRIMLTMTNIV